MLPLVLSRECARAQLPIGTRQPVLAANLAKANPFLIWAVIGAQALHIAAMHIPVLNGVLGIQPVAVETWIAVAVLATTLAVLMEGWKWVQRRLERTVLKNTRVEL